ncbi:hypothetical protein ABPG77_009914 [Micractinium sp. CCAP 211/92]
MRNPFVLVALFCAMSAWAPVMAMAPMPAMEPAGSILDLLQMHTDKFSTLLGVVQIANLTDVLADPTLVATAFLPDNAAVEATLMALNISAAQFAADSPEDLARALMYHIVPGEALTTDLLSDGMILQSLIEGPTGELKVVKEQGEEYPYLETTYGQQVPIVEANMPAGDAIVHVVSMVLAYGNMTFGAMPPSDEMAPMPGM